ncbi:MAG: trimethylamine methyltransferase family protein, partial [Bacteroidetes bacterium]|nr:trimethylamine methyltransferase family protein [Bacteroidota bacterium]
MAFSTRIMLGCLVAGVVFWGAPGARNAGAQPFTFTLVQTDLTALEYGAMAFADLDGDGDFDLVAGGEGRFREKPFCHMSSCYIVPPLRFTSEACETLEGAVRHGMPVILICAGQAGATSPAALAGAAVQGVAEALAGLVYVNLIAPGHPILFGAWPFVSDLRTGAMSGGSGEQALLMAASAQMANFYGIPASVAAGMTDSKVPDAQSGFEKGYTTALAGLAGPTMVHEAAGMHASLLGVAFESFVIDNDMLGAVLRTVRGIEVTDESLSVDVIAEVTAGPGHYLGHPQTLDLME